MNVKIRIAIAAAAAAGTLAAAGVAVTAGSASAQPDHRATTAASAVTTSSGWQPLVLRRGWSAFHVNSYGTPAYLVQGGILYLRGAVVTGNVSITASVFAALPPGARPAHMLWFACTTGAPAGSMHQSLSVRQNGALAFNWVPVGQPAWLDGLAFPLSE